MIYGQREEKIYSLKPSEFTRFLGVWIGSSNNKKFVMNQILKEINGIVVRKRITPEQMAYIINAVIIPKIEYRGHLSIFI